MGFASKAVHVVWRTGRLGFRNARETSTSTMPGAWRGLHLDGLSSELQVHQVVVVLT
jgi:hypothetical protein